MDPDVTRRLVRQTGGTIPRCAVGSSQVSCSSRSWPSSPRDRSGSSAHPRRPRCRARARPLRSPPSRADPPRPRAVRPEPPVRQLRRAERVRARLRRRRPARWPTSLSCPSPSSVQPKRRRRWMRSPPSCWERPTDMWGSSWSRARPTRSWHRSGSNARRMRPFWSWRPIATRSRAISPRTTSGWRSSAPTRSSRMFARSRGAARPCSGWTAFASSPTGR